MACDWQEAQQILNLPDTPVEQIDPALYKERYDYLFAANEKANGGTLYLQSKVPLFAFVSEF